nr:methyltransferase domain-containing protein [Afifella sp. IM 167]
MPVVDQRAIASRRDLARVNAIMGQARIAARLLRDNLAQPPKRILEIGAGDGSFMLKLAERLSPQWKNVEVVLLDRQHLLSDERFAAFSALGWRVRPLQADIFEWTARAEEERFDAVTTNLFLHHFSDTELRLIFERLAMIAPLLTATEPLRSGVALFGTRMLWALGANEVTRHDAAASVRAGFVGNELSTLWPEEPAFETFERRRGLFTHTFVARRAGRRR